MYYRRASSGFATMVFSATGTVQTTWPAAENSSVFWPLLHRHHRTITSATGNSQDRICCNARNATKVRCGGSAFSRRVPQSPDGTAHEQRYQLCQLRAEAFLSPRSAQKSVSTPFGQRSVCIAPQMPFPRLPTLQNTSCGLFSARIPSILSRLPLQYRDLPKHIACGMLQRLSTTEF